MHHQLRTNKEQTALVSVIIPCFEQAHFLPEAIESVLTQTHCATEIIVVDDGSPDNVFEVVSWYPTVKCVQQQNQGLAAARNAGFRFSTGHHVLFLDADDRLMPHDYRVRQAREIGTYQDDLEGFLRSLEMAAVIEPVGPGNLDRVANLLAKTNQFNLTTRRHSRAEVARLAEAAGSIALVLRLRDKFGEQGIIGLVIAVAEQEEQSLVIDSLLVSCRALGRGVEHALWAAMVNRAYRKGVRKLQAEYVATGKNSLVANFYDKLGFRQVEGNGSIKRYEFTPLVPCLYPAWINAIDESHDPDAGYYGRGARAGFCNSVGRNGEHFLSYQWNAFFASRTDISAAQHHAGSCAGMQRHSLKRGSIYY